MYRLVNKYIKHNLHSIITRMRKIIIITIINKKISNNLGFKKNSLNLKAKEFTSQKMKQTN